jgi:hypothetical protein
VWCYLPDGLNAAEVAQCALTGGVVLAPGHVFSLSGTASGFLRFNAAQSCDERILMIFEDAMTNCGAQSTGPSTSDREHEMSTRFYSAVEWLSFAGHKSAGTGWRTAAHCGSELVVCL